MDVLRSLFDLDDFLKNIAEKQNSWDELVEETNKIIEEKFENAISDLSQMRPPTFAVPKVPRARMKVARASSAVRKKSTRASAIIHKETEAPEGRVKRSTRLASKQSCVNYNEDFSILSSVESDKSSKAVRQSSRVASKIQQKEVDKNDLFAIPKTEIVVKKEKSEPAKEEPETRTGTVLGTTPSEVVPAIATKRPTSTGNSVRTVLTAAGATADSHTPASKFKKLNKKEPVNEIKMEKPEQVAMSGVPTNATKRPTSTGNSVRTLLAKAGITADGNTPASKFKKLNKDNDGLEVLDYTMGGFANTGLLTSTPMSTSEEQKLAKIIKTEKAGRKSSLKSDNGVQVVPDSDTVDRAAPKVEALPNFNATFDVKKYSPENKKYGAGKENIPHQTPSKIPVNVHTPKRNGFSACKPESVKKLVQAFEKQLAPPSKILFVNSEATKKTKEQINRNQEEAGRQTRANATRNTSASSETQNEHLAAKPSKVLHDKNNIMKAQDTKDRDIEALKKKDGAVEEAKRKREERGRRAAAAREAAEREKLETALKNEKEKEEKQKQILKEKEDKAKQEILKKKAMAAQKAAEMEMRRKQEEEARIARLREIEEEEQRIQAKKLREQQEQERLRIKRIEELRAQEMEKLKEKSKIAAQKMNEMVKKAAAAKNGTTSDDYGITDISARDSSDEESRPKRTIPTWAERKNRKGPLMAQNKISKKLVYYWFYNSQDKKPKVTELFSENVRMRPRTSSAFWNSRICTDDTLNYSGFSRYMST